MKLELSGIVLSRTVLSLVAASWMFVSPALGDGEGHAKRRGSQLFFRAVGARNNAPLLPKTRSAWTQDRRTATGNTGMSDLGFTEYPFCFGKMDFTFVENFAYFPRLISGAQADETIVNTADMVMDHVYEPDGCVWGLRGREFVQTFTATRPELVSVTLLVASEPGHFRAALVDGGPGGRQVGPAKRLYSGHSLAWGYARWPAGQAPLVVGGRYGIRVWREDGAVWVPYLHATGNAYDGGLLYVDGKPRAESDMAVWIVEEPVDLRRSPIEGADEEGWVYDSTGVTFLARTPNIRMLSLKASPVVEDPADLVVRVWSDDGVLLAGPNRGLASGPKNGERSTSILFAQDELPVTPGGRYRVDLSTAGHRAELPRPQDVTIVRRDIQLRVYGEPKPGALPAIFNLAARFEDESQLKLVWSEPFPCPTHVEIRGPEVDNWKKYTVEQGQTEILLSSLRAGHEYRFRLTSVGSSGLAWRTPLYQVRMPHGPEVAPVAHSPLYPREFVALAPPQLSSAPRYGPLRYQEEVKLTNADFEDGLDSWVADSPGMLDAPARSGSNENDIGTKWGERMAGFTHAAGRERQQVFAKSTLSQTIPTRPDHVYVLAAMLRTAVKHGPRGDTRVRIFAAAAGENGDGDNSSQWYWTDGRWTRFQHRWRATAETTTIGFGFFRWRDLDQASAYVDHVHVYDLGPTAPGPRDPLGRRVGDPFGRTLVEPARVLVDHRVEADDRVEGFLRAPPGFAITAMGARADHENITTVWLRVQPLLPDGTLGNPEQLRGGRQPDANLEARVELPKGYVATGFGAGAAPESAVMRLRLWGRPLLDDGSLGDEREFRGDADLESSAEREVRLEKGRVLTSVGLNCTTDDIHGIRAHSARLIRTATARARSN